MEQCENVNVIMRKLKNFISSTVRLSTNPKKKMTTHQHELLVRANAVSASRGEFCFIFFQEKTICICICMYVYIYIYIYPMQSAPLEGNFVYFFLGKNCIYMYMYMCIYIYIYPMQSAPREGKNQGKKTQKKKNANHQQSLLVCANVVGASKNKKNKKIKKITSSHSQSGPTW